MAVSTNSSESQAFERQLAEMVEIASADPRQRIVPAQVKEWAGNLQNHQFYNLFALMVAERYAAGALSYRVCDSIMNDLWWAWLEGEAGPKVPEPFYEIFLAFDAGEYHRKRDRSDDPVKDHTDPLIAEILSRQKHPMT
ncbi:hypothetical protein [Paracoccus laeviglucosivorans]|uniref:Uncharacterized protein n=1 Tax=Paracoccus laeviglucosivorans TaxID=1197861 RepID=A0A521CXF8_9RHOB|nr:hypothetical protein [Paracoccus laeviglucosivorans]SMO64133.1 hypothetical protein SAMN06265221_105261 [Paracoccus laeviglucosivorans]